MGWKRFPVVTLEEHYWDPEIDAYGAGIAPMVSEETWLRLSDFESVRLKEMDCAGVDLQVLSLSVPSLQNAAADRAGELGRIVNDRLAEVVARHPDRFAAFAALPTPDPEAAVRELERAVRDLGFKGCMICGPTHGLFLDDDRFRPLLAKAAELGAPVYIHPSPPSGAIVDQWLQPYASRIPGTALGCWGFILEASTHVFRLVMSGVFDEIPGLTMIAGHMGEGLPFYFQRIDELYRRERQGRSFAQTFKEHFYVTTSAFFSNAALDCTIAQMGIDRVMYAVDYPYVDPADGARWLDTLQLTDLEMRSFLSDNACRLLNIEVTG